MAACECGCGAEVEGRKFLPGHQLVLAKRKAQETKTADEPAQKAGPVVVSERVISGEEMLQEVAGLPAGPGRDGRIERACEVICEFVGEQAPLWKERIAIAREAKAWNARQFVCAMLGYMLDRSLHLEAPAHPYLEPGNTYMAEKSCALASCGKTFRPLVPGQAYCSNPCGFKAAKEREASAA